MSADTPEASIARQIAWGSRDLDVEKLLSEQLHELNSGDPTGARTFAICTGKDAPRMMRGVLRSALGESLHSGIVIHDRFNPPSYTHAKVRFFTGDHPIPSEASARAALALTEIVRGWRIEKDDRVVVGVSGGTSALIASPRPPLRIEQLATLTRELLRSGRSVSDVNDVRRHLGLLHNGGLGALLRPARVDTFIVCDNADGRVDSVGSGPTVSLPPDARLIEGAFREAGIDSPDFRSVIDLHPSPAAESKELRVLASIGDVARACASRARKLGVRPIVHSDSFTGTWQDLVRLFENVLSSVEPRQPRKTEAHIVTGEPIVRASGSQLGGRCQQVALGMAPALARVQGSSFVAYATDERDNLASVAGAELHSLRAGAIAGDPRYAHALRNYESSPVLRTHGALIEATSSAINLCDTFVLLA